MTVLVTFTDGTRKEFETAEKLESGWLRCTRPRSEPRSDLPGETTTKYYRLEALDAVERDST
ncbi:hypothetical protein [Natronococcus sp.]|uniref:hypothetical protein n=1 Tax=Natronococcus sp. TaxID=35747 RepID=UPI003A4DF83C